jgi:hypothetical protein
VEDHGWRRTNGVWSDSHARSTTLFGRLSLATPVLNAGVGVDRREQRALSPARPAAITESVTANASWRPLDLPELQLRVAHVNAFDAARRERDVTTDLAQLSTRYFTRANDVRFQLGWTRSVDHRHASESAGVEQSLLATRADELFGGRTSTYLSGTLQARSTTTSSRGLGGSVVRQQVPAEGRSVVLVAPLVSADVQLSPNPLLVDGNTGASAAVNLGFGLAALGDRDAREVGARFADVVTDVNRIHVWLATGATDRAIAPEVGRALALSARVWRSDDNQHWSEVTVAPGDAFASEVEDRLEIRIPQTRARWLKVTLQPLALGVTTDPVFRDLFVSELQFQLELPVEHVPHRASSVLAAVTGIARTTIVRAPELVHDASVSVSRRTDPSLTAYTIVNGLSVRKTLWADVTASARGARQDVNDGDDHEGSWQWSAGLAGHPLTTAFWTVTYSGAATEDQLSHSVTALARADLYEGISMQASGGGSIVTQGSRVSRSGQTSGTLSLVPNRYVTLSGGALYSRSVASDPEVGDVLTQFGRVDGSVSLTPAPALSASGTISRVLLGARPTTLATLQLNYFPLRGEVQLAVAYSKTLDTEAEATTEILSPSLRWNVRSGVSLTASYALVENVSPVQTLDSSAFTARLLILL